MKPITAIVTAILVCVTATAAWAGETTVTGSLVTPDGKAVKGYPVVISGTYPSGTTHNWVTTTDEAGAFRFDALPPGKYVVSPSNDPSASRTFELSSDKAWWALKSDEPSTKQDVGAIEVDPGPKMRSLAH